VAPVPVMNVPATHPLHTVAWVCVAYFPELQNEHSSSPEVPVNFPTVQSWHTVDEVSPTPVAYLPAAHPVHVPESMYDPAKHASVHVVPDPSDKSAPGQDSHATIPEPSMK
jgi:hypothetical protein